MRKVGILGVGYKHGCGDTENDILKRAVQEALYDANLNANYVDAVISCDDKVLKSREFYIQSNEDICGLSQKPVLWLCCDGLYGLFLAYMQVASGLFNVVQVISSATPTKTLATPQINFHAFNFEEIKPTMDSTYYLAGIEMKGYLEKSGLTNEHCAHVVVKNKKNALNNPRALFGADMNLVDVLSAEMIYRPLSTMDIAPWIDTAAVLIVASEGIIKKDSRKKIWIDAIGCGSDTGKPLWTKEEISTPLYLEELAKKVYSNAGISNPEEDLDFVEIEDSFSYLQLQSLNALGFSESQMPWQSAENENLRINPSGGTLGIGNSFWAKGLMRTIEAVLQLRMEAGRNQIEPEPARALIQTCCSLPSRNAGIAIISSEK